MEWVKLINLCRQGKDRRLASALDSFEQNLYFGDGLDPETAKENLRSGLVEITRQGRHSCNGLLITDDGYFLTARHCVDDLKGAKVRISLKQEFPLEKVYTFSTKGDIALAKARVPGSSRARQYSLFNSNQSTPIFGSLPVALITRRDGVVSTSYGFAELCLNDYVLRFVNFGSKPGDSGGAIMTGGGRLFGIYTSRDNFGYRYGINVIKALELVEFSKRRAMRT